MKRIDLTDDTLNNLAFLDPDNIRAKAHPSIFPLIKRFPNITKEVGQKIDDEFRELRYSLSDIPGKKHQKSSIYKTAHN